MSGRMGPGGLNNLQPASLAAYRSAGLLLNEEAIFGHLLATARLEITVPMAKAPGGEALRALQDNARQILNRMRVPWQ